MRQDLLDRPVLVTLLGILNAFVAVGCLLLGAALLLLAGHPALWVLGGLLLVWFALSAACADAMFKLKRHGRVLQIVLAAPGLILFPVGTIFSLLVILYMLQRHVGLLFSGRTLTQMAPDELAMLEKGAAARAWQSALGVATACVFVMTFFFGLPVIAAIAIPNFLHAVERAQEKRTTTDMHAIAEAVEKYAVDNNEYPPAEEIADLEPHVVPLYLEALPTADGWGREFRFQTWPGRHGRRVPDSYALVSPGKDGAFETDDPTEYAEGPTTPGEDDIVIVNGELVRWPERVAR